MWICSKLGFFSIVEKGGPGMWQIRARCENDLHQLIEATGLDTEVISTPKADYGFRIVVDHDDLARVFSTLADSIDYSNFKNRIASLQEQQDKLHAYHDFWGGMLKVQTATARSGGAMRNHTKRLTKSEILKEYTGGCLTRMLITFDGFHKKHGHWPTKYRLPRSALDGLRDSFLTPLGFQLLNSKLRLVTEDDMIHVAEDDAGLVFDYDRDHGTYDKARSAADEWLWGVKLD